ncbi:hypothetical protein HELRODRAFT_173341 [Helobdella robusta]|uniref:Uncharacterized protein n=1 Tax=Helobdella robusta TaxID=6412 RepID=T1F6P9_HELRO|nr:hypothetical protein HELRODRAFT_173341 [Helobdella robusta]ESO03646.1 hypothetical protein HELRODRAFT_173341 [Helobdella robusta]
MEFFRNIFQCFTIALLFSNRDNSITSSSSSTKPNLILRNLLELITVVIDTVPDTGIRTLPVAFSDTSVTDDREVYFLFDAAYNIYGVHFTAFNVASFTLRVFDKEDFNPKEFKGVLSSTNNYDQLFEGGQIANSISIVMKPSDASAVINVTEFVADVDVYDQRSSILASVLIALSAILGTSSAAVIILIISRQRPAQKDSSTV